MLAEIMLTEAEDYYWRMAARKRLLRIDEGRTGVCTFFLLDSELEIHDFYDRRCWTTPADHAEGSIIYIDKLIAKQFDRNLWRAIEAEITDRFPGWEQAVWYRPRQEQDVRYTFRRKGVVHGDHV